MQASKQTAPPADLSKQDRWAGVQLGEESLPASKVVLAMGPWTGLASRWLPGVPPIVGQLGHSVVLQAQHPLSSHCFFVNHSGPGMEGAQPTPCNRLCCCSGKDMCRIICHG